MGRLSNLPVMERNLRKMQICSVAADLGGLLSVVFTLQLTTMRSTLVFHRSQAPLCLLTNFRWPKGKDPVTKHAATTWSPLMDGNCRKTKLYGGNRPGRELFQLWSHNRVSPLLFYCNQAALCLAVTLRRSRGHCGIFDYLSVTSGRPGKITRSPLDHC